MLLLSLATIFVACAAENRQNLGGNWYVDSDNGTVTALPARVPGGIYSDLMRNNVIGDILQGNNDVDTRWVGNTSWIYYRNFTVNAAFLNNNHVNLIFEGLDTIATISINNQQIGTAENMFRRYIFNVKDYLVEGTNNVSVFFTSPIQEAARLGTEQAANYSIPPTCPPAEYHGECNVNMLRKMQASFGWDWGPAFPSVGIWKDVYLETFNNTVIRYVLIDLETGEDADRNYIWMIHIRTLLDSTNLTGVIDYSITIEDVPYTVSVNVTPKSTDNAAVIVVPQAIATFWWPNGYGDQKLYNLSTQFRAEDGETSERFQNIGLRTIGLDQRGTFDDTNFYFQVTGTTLFARGSNQVPLHILPELGQEPELIERVLGAAKAANMNMLRVWGGGVYESDYFYEVADRLGIMIWQDFMFACAMYPSNDPFLTNVREEVRHQVRRLYNHPSIAIWAANNENEVALVDDWYGTSSKDDVFRSDYLRLYIDTIRSEVNAVSNNLALFVSSSPSNGIAYPDGTYIALNPQDPHHGDVHFYNYILNSLNMATYPIPKFVSEYGYQSLPDLDTWATVIDNINDFSLTSDFFTHRQHKPGAMVQPIIETHFNLPDPTHPNYTDAFIYFSQLSQALSVKFETEFYRSYQRRYNNESFLGNTCGMLFWQLNDVWVAPSWSSIDYTGKWKILHYIIRESFRPDAVVAYLNIERSLEVYAISESFLFSENYISVSIHVDLYRYSSFDKILTHNESAVIEIARGVPMWTTNVDDFLVVSGCGALEDARYNCFFHLRFEVLETDVTAENFFFPAEIKDSNVSLANVQIIEIQDVGEGNAFDITLQTDNIALWVWLDSHQIRGQFSTNGFVLIVPQVIIRFDSEAITTIEELQATITITYVNNPNYS